MSGGSYDYLYSRIEDTYVDRMFDKQLNRMMNDLCGVLKELEWWQSGDTGEEEYREAVKSFKNQWFRKRSKTDIVNISHLLDEVIGQFETIKEEL
jgi:hypothetical protein